MTHIKRIDEMTLVAHEGEGRYDDSRFCYLDYLNMEVYVYNDFGKFSEQFDKIPTSGIYDAVTKLYDFASVDEKPDRNDRGTLLEWLYEYCCAEVEENR